MVSLLSFTITFTLCFVVPTDAKRVLVDTQLDEKASVNEVALEQGGGLTQKMCMMVPIKKDRHFKDALLEDGPDGGNLCHMKWQHSLGIKLKDVPKYCDKIFATDPIKFHVEGHQYEIKFEKSGCKCEYFPDPARELKAMPNTRVAFSCFLTSSSHSGGVQSSNADNSQDKVVNAADTKTEPTVVKPESTEDRVETAEPANEDAMKDKVATGGNTQSSIEPTDLQSSPEPVDMTKYEGKMMGRLVYQTKMKGQMIVKYGEKDLNGVGDATWAVFTPSAKLPKWQLSREDKMKDKVNDVTELLAGWIRFFNDIASNNKKCEGDVTITAINSVNHQQDLRFAVLQKDGSIVRPQVGSTIDMASVKRVAIYTRNGNVFQGYTTMSEDDFYKKCNQNRGSCDVTKGFK